MPQGQGQRLRDFLSQATGGRHGWVTELAKAAGVRRQTVYAWFNDRGAPNLDSLEAIAQAIGVRRYQIVAAMDGEAPAVPMDDRTREFLVAELERLLAERDARQPQRKPRSGGGAA